MEAKKKINCCFWKINLCKEMTAIVIANHIRSSLFSLRDQRSPGKYEA
jgi:hypothetical protein